MASRRRADEPTMEKTSFHLDTFNGSAKNSKFWLLKFEKVAKLKKWSNEDKAVHLCLLLVGEAEAWYHTLTENVQDDFDLLKASFEARFLPTESDRNARYEEFIGLAQTTSESSNTYLENVVRMGRELGKSEQEIMDKSIHGLLFTTRNFVISKEPKCMEDVKKYAKLGQSVGISNSEADTVSAVNYKRQSEDQRRPETTTKRWKQTAGSGFRESCKHCGGEYPHDPFKCRHRHTVCYQCNHRGHIARVCPMQNQYGS